MSASQPIRRTAIAGLLALGSLAVGSESTLAGTGLYDFNSMLGQRHPFDTAPAAQPAVPAAQPAPMQPAQPAAPAPASAPAQAQTQAAQPAAAPGVHRDTAEWYDDQKSSPSGLGGGQVYATFTLFGAYSKVDSPSVTNITSLQTRHGSDEVMGNSLAVGYDFEGAIGHPIRLELEGGIRYRFDLDYRGVNGGTTYGYGTNLATFYGMLNGYYDFSLSSINNAWRPFLGAGIGWAHHWADSERNIPGGAAAKESKDFTTDTLSWAVMGGVNYQWDTHWKAGFTLRYADLGTVEVGPFSGNDKIEADYWTIDAIFGVSYLF